MKFSRLWVGLFFVLAACQPTSLHTITLIEENNTQVFESRANTLQEFLSETQTSLSADERILVNGVDYSLEMEFPSTRNLQIQIQRAIQITLVTPQQTRALKSSAATVGQMLLENGLTPGAQDSVSPALSTPLRDALTVTYIPARVYTVNNGGSLLSITSSAPNVGTALAEAGIPLMGLDTSFPLAVEPLPADGQIQVTRIREVVEVVLQSIPFLVEERTSEEIAFGSQEIIQNGVNGTALVRTRIRYENGVEVSRIEETKSTVQDPVPQIVAAGSKIVLAPVGGNAPYQYWYATEMYASWYSPCNSGTNGCSYGTASGARAGYGIVAVDYSYYSYLAGMRVYIPGYGLATIGDTGGGPIVETAFGVPRYQWIDLGYDDNNIGALSGWVIVYFLEPAPAEIPYFFQK